MNGVEEVEIIAIDSTLVWQIRSLNSLMPTFNQPNNSIKASRGSSRSTPNVGDKDSSKTVPSSLDGTYETRPRRSSSTETVLRASSSIVDAVQPKDPMRKSSSAETLKKNPEIRSIRFAPTLTWSTTSDLAQAPGPTFHNPFLEETEETVSRKSSLSSDTSDHLPHTFAGHRDTLARLYDIDASEEDEDFENHTPTQDELSIFCKSNETLR